jgi:hypothetical protein
MGVQTKPDSPNYLARIVEIQEAIIATSDAVPDPIAVPTRKPYWINNYQKVSQRKSAANEWIVTFRCTMLLIRGSESNKDKDSLYALAAADIDTVMFEFVTNEDCQGLITATYTSVQSGFIRSVRLGVQSIGDFPTISGGVFGSSHPLEWQHRMKNLPG